jgi:hypothetical protein
MDKMKQGATERGDPRPSPTRGRGWRVGVALFGVGVAAAVAVPIGLIVFIVAAGAALSNNSDPDAIFVVGGILALAAGTLVGYRLWKRVRHGSGSWIAPAAGYLAVVVAAAWFVSIGQSLYRADRYKSLSSSPFGLASVDLPDDGRNVLALLRGLPLLDAKHPEPEPPNRQPDYTRGYENGGAQLDVLDSVCCSFEPVDQDRDAAGALLTYVDGGSDTIAVARDVPGRIVYVEIDSELGRSRCFGEAESDWYLCVDGEDPASERLIRTLVEAMTEAGWTHAP